MQFLLLGFLKMNHSIPVFQWPLYILLETASCYKKLEFGARPVLKYVSWVLIFLQNCFLFQNQKCSRLEQSVQDHEWDPKGICEPELFQSILPPIIPCVSWKPLVEDHIGSWMDGILCCAGEKGDNVCKMGNFSQTLFGSGAGVTHACTLQTHLADSIVFWHHISDPHTRDIYLQSGLLRRLFFKHSG